VHTSALHVALAHFYICHPHLFTHSYFVWAFLHCRHGGAGLCHVFPEQDIIAADAGPAANTAAMAAAAINLVAFLLILHRARVVMETIWGGTDGAIAN
jgi:hypothetical protein